MVAHICNPASEEGDHIFDMNIGFREPRAGVKVSDEEFA